MNFPKQIKDIVYTLLQEPTLDNFREFIRNQTGEHNTIDFKEQWLEKGKLAKIILALANSGGGVLVLGVHENDDHSFECRGLDELKDKTNISHDISKYISSDLKYEIYDFVYASSEYKELEDKKFQMLSVEETPEYLPFISLKDGEDIKGNVIYIRRGTATEVANGTEIRELISKKIEYEYPHTGQPLGLGEHLEQLEELYDHIKQTKFEYEHAGLRAITESFKKAFGGYSKEVENQYYPKESYDEYISRIIQEKKKKIERLLDLK